MVFHQEVKDEYDAILRGEVSPKDWDVDWLNKNIFVATLIKYPKLVEELEDKSMWEDTIEFIDLVYHNKMPKKNPSSDLAHINLRGLPIPSKEIVKKLTEDESYEGYYEEWNWKYLAYDWLGEYKPKYSRDWVNKTFRWDEDISLLFVFDMFWNPNATSLESCSGLMFWFEDIGLTDDYTKDYDFSDDLSKAVEFLGSREEDREMYYKYRRKHNSIDPTPESDGEWKDLDLGESYDSEEWGP
ncbi:hypothetical protein BX667DRAFT_523286 [Coemansia mojavensis]|nr:hypothetical protein BX667DRAFT_523286 [Coemansia mojavensis]